MKQVRSKIYSKLYSLAVTDQRKVKIATGIMVTLFIMLLNLDIAHAKTEFEEAWDAFMAEYRIIIAFITGFGGLTSLLVFIFHFIKLGSMPSHPIQRKQAMDNMLISAVTTALLGGVSLILTIFYGILFEPTPPDTGTAPATETVDVDEIAPDNALENGSDTLIA